MKITIWVNKIDVLTSFDVKGNVRITVGEDTVFEGTVE